MTSSGLTFVGTLLILVMLVPTSSPEVPSDPATLGTIRRLTLDFARESQAI